MPTLKQYRQEVARKLGGFKVATVSINPDPTDTLAQRSVLSAALYDADKGAKGYSGQFCWSGKYRDQRRFRENGYRSLAYAVFTPPTSGTYTITAYGYGVTAPIAFNANAAAVQAAVVAVDSALNTVTVSGTGTPYVMSLPDVIDIEISAGTITAGGGIGAIEVQRGFTKALVAGDEIEIHSKLPVDDDDNIQGLNTLINMALRRMWFIDRFPITPVVNSRGIQTYYGLSGQDWLTHKNQLIALYDATLWQLVATVTPPGSGTYTATLSDGGNTYTTSAVAFNASAATLQAALQTAVSGSGLVVTVADGSGTLVVTLAETYYATPTLSVSTGTVVNARTMLETPFRYPNTWTFEYDGEQPFIRNYNGQAGRSFYLEAYRPGHSWICPQASYGVKGTDWVSSTDGLVDDYDQAVPSVEDVSSVAYALACRQLATVGPGHEIAKWDLEAKRAEQASAVTKTYDLPFNDAPGGGTRVSSGIGNKGFW